MERIRILNWFVFIRWTMLRMGLMDSGGEGSLLTFIFLFFFCYLCDSSGKSDVLCHKSEGHVGVCVCEFNTVMLN